MSLIHFLQQNPWAFYGFCLLLGASVGSFLNVVVYRLPKMLEREWRSQCNELFEIEQDPVEEKPLTLSRPGSSCPGCGHKIRIHENIPVISYLLLKGRCSSCSTKISLRYPLVETFTILLTLVVAYKFGVSIQTLTALPLVWSLIALSLIDFDHKLLPDNIVLPALWAGLLINLGGTFTDISSAVIGAVAGYLTLWLVFQLFRLLTGKEGMGYGDFKLFGLFGAWLGWQYLPQILILSSVVGALAGITLVALRGRDKNIPIPFGPYLAAAGFISLMWGAEINHAYLSWAGLL
jgi:leader peptidase (prepilin peptidase)/N-methyltransferase